MPTKRFRTQKHPVSLCTAAESDQDMRAVVRAMHFQEQEHVFCLCATAGSDEFSRFTVVGRPALACFVVDFTVTSVTRPDDPMKKVHKKNWENSALMY